MSSLSRQVARRFTVFAVMISLVSTLFASAHPLAETDRDCGPLTLREHASPAVWQAVTPPSPDTHCAFCHWLRAVGGASPSGAIRTAPAVMTADALRPTNDASVCVAALGPRSSRAPPRTVTTA